MAKCNQLTPLPFKGLMLQTDGSRTNKPLECVEWVTCGYHSVLAMLLLVGQEVKMTDLLVAELLRTGRNTARLPVAPYHRSREMQRHRRHFYIMCATCMSYSKSLRCTGHAVARDVKNMFFCAGFFCCFKTSFVFFCSFCFSFGGHYCQYSTHILTVYIKLAH